MRWVLNIYLVTKILLINNGLINPVDFNSLDKYQFSEVTRKH